MKIARDPFVAAPWFGRTEPDSDAYARWQMKMWGLGACCGVIFGLIAALVTWFAKAAF